jgi:hypothetical protein
VEIVHQTFLGGPFLLLALALASLVGRLAVLDERGQALLDLCLRPPGVDPRVDRLERGGELRLLRGVEPLRELVVRPVDTLDLMKNRTMNKLGLIYKKINTISIKILKNDKNKNEVK